jgi:hypothetical protein
MVFLSLCQGISTKGRTFVPHASGPIFCRQNHGGGALSEQAMRVVLAGAAQDAASRLSLYHDLLDAIATHRVGDRPDRYEPRVKKRRRNHYGWLTKPRAEMKRKMAKGVTKN